MRVLLSGGSGVIGQHLAAMIDADPSLSLAGTADQDSFFEGPVSADVLIDFSHPELTRRSLRFAVQHQIPAVIGTTGLKQEDEHRIDQAAAAIPICVAANFSLGVNLLLSLAKRSAAVLGKDYDVEISEIHHRRKLDAPSGTALALGQAVAEARGLTLAEARVDDRSQSRSARMPDEIGFQAVRGGDVAGEHTVFFLADGERLELTHRATDRRIFARGALFAAKKLLGRPPGRVHFASLVLDQP
ncbi:MAG: 4-hydroxy-tetrahydrodipicolinate reductase [Wenzhouxiangella sp.]